MWKKRKNYLQFVFVIMSIAVVLYLVIKENMTLQDVLAYANDNRWKMLVILLFLYALKACCWVIMFSGLNVAVAISFPFLQALAVNVFGSILCFSISYLFGRMTKTEKLEEKLNENPKINRYLSNAKDNNVVLCFVLHMAGLSSEALGVLFGIMRMRYLPYIITSVLGVLPGMICVTLSGGTKDPTKPLFWILYGGNLLLAVIALLYLRIRMKSK